MSKLISIAGFAALLAACSTLDEDTAYADEPVAVTAPNPLAVFEAEQEEMANDDAVASLDEKVDTAPQNPVVPTHTFGLRRGETVHHFARWSEQPIERIAELSGLDLHGTYAVGTRVVVELSSEDRSMVEARRDSHHQTRANNYLASRGSTSTTFYKVKTGDTAWTIARTFEGMPVWLLESLNPSTDLDVLRPGQELMVPVFNDVAVSVDDEVKLFE